MAAGAQKLHLALAVPLISPFELQHQIFREHPAPEQLFLIATSQHCCPCLYINTYSVPRTEHRSPALPPPPAPAGPAPAAGPHAAPRGPPSQAGGQLCRDGLPGPAVLLPPCGAWLDVPVPCDCPMPDAHALPLCGGAGRRERPPACFPRRMLLSPPLAVPAGPGRAEAPDCAGPGAPQPLPPVWRPWAVLTERHSRWFGGGRGWGAAEEVGMPESSNPTAA